MIQINKHNRRGRFIVPIADLSAPIGINLIHRSRIPEGEGGWADEQKVHVVKWDVPFLSPHSLRSGQALSAAKGLSGCPFLVTLSEAKGPSHCAQHDRPLHYHPERSEGSVTLGVEMHRCAQHDRVPLSP